MAARGTGRRPDRPHRGVRRRPAGVAGRRVTLSAVAVAVVLVGVFAFADELRHPLPGDGELINPEFASDPRDDVECPQVARPGERQDVEPLEVSSEELLSCPGSYDGRLVRYEGEAVGEVLERGDHAWVQLNDDVYSEAAPLPQRTDYAGGNSGIAARLPAGGADAIRRTGGPHVRGDVVSVVGRFHRAMPTSAEAAVIDARRVQRVAAGEPIAAPVLTDRRVAAITLAVLAVAMVLGERVVARRR